MVKTVPFFIFLLITAAITAGCTPTLTPVSPLANTAGSPASAETQPASIPSTTVSAMAEKREVPVPLTETPTEVTPPQFQFVYVTEKNTGSDVVSDLKIARFNGEKIEVISQHPDIPWMVHAVWSPDGSKIAFSECRSLRSPQERNFLRIINRDGTETINPENLFHRMNVQPDCNASISWSPDSKNIALVGTLIEETWVEYVFILSIEEERIENITENWTMEFETHPRCIGVDPILLNHQCQEEMTRENTPLWSPDGSMIAMVVGNDIYTVGVDGNNLRKVTNSEVSLNPVTWTPDNTRIIYTNNDGSSTNGIYSVSVETGAVQQIAEGWEPALSPDGTQIAFSVFSGIYMIDLDENNLNKIVSSFPGEPHWTPDGNFIVIAHSGNTFSIITKDGRWREKFEFEESDALREIAVEGE